MDILLIAAYRYLFRLQSTSVETNIDWFFEFLDTYPNIVSWCSLEIMNCEITRTGRLSSLQTMLHNRIQKIVPVVDRIPSVPPSIVLPEQLILTAFRYCLGQQSYICSGIVLFLTQYQDNLTKETKEIIQKEITLAIERKKIRTNADYLLWQLLLENNHEIPSQYELNHFKSNESNGAKSKNIIKTVNVDHYYILRNLDFLTLTSSPVIYYRDSFSKQIKD